MILRGIREVLEQLWLEGLICLSSGPEPNFRLSKVTVREN
jgi:hypothetical protein